MGDGDGKTEGAAAESTKATPAEVTLESDEKRRSYDAAVGNTSGAGSALPEKDALVHPVDALTHQKS